MMGLIRTVSQIVLVVAILVTTGCSPNRANPTPTLPVLPELTAVTEPQSDSLPTTLPLETNTASNALLRIDGDSAPYTSTPLQLAQPVTLRAHWEQTSQGEFSFGLATANSESVATPDEVLFELILGPSDGVGEAEFPAGTYVVQVTAADGPWSIWIERVAEP